MRHITALFSGHTASIELLDGVLGRRSVIAVADDGLSLEKTEPWGPFRGAEVCGWEDGFIGLHVAESGAFLHRLSRDGAILAPFGERLFEGSHAWNATLTQGSLLCMPESGRVLYAGMMGDLVTYAVGGGVVWHRKILDFYPILIERARGGIDFTYAPPPHNQATYPVGVFLLDDTYVLLQLNRQERTTRDGAIVVDMYAGIDSRIIRTSDGAEVGRQSDLPRVLSLRDGRALVMGLDPEPWVEVRALSLGRVPQEP